MYERLTAAALRVDDAGVCEERRLVGLWTQPTSKGEVLCVQRAASYNAGVVHASEYIIQTLLFIGLYTHMHAHHKRTADRPGRRSSGVLHTHRAPETIQRCCQGINPAHTLKRKTRCVSEFPPPRIYYEPLSGKSYIRCSPGTLWEWLI